jgi:hypothetical protein
MRALAQGSTIMHDHIKGGCPADRAPGAPPGPRRPAPGACREPGILHETQIFAADAPSHLALGKNGRPVHPLTVHRWIRRGVRGVRLEAIRLGHRWVTSMEAVERFAARLTTPGEVVPSPSRTAAARRLGLTRADHEADAAGL